MRLPTLPSSTADVRVWTSNYIPHITMDMIIQTCLSISLSVFVKGAPGVWLGLFYTNAGQETARYLINQRPWGGYSWIWPHAKQVSETVKKQYITHYLRILSDKWICNGGMAGLSHLMVAMVTQTGRTTTCHPSIIRRSVHYTRRNMHRVRTFLSFVVIWCRRVLRMSCRINTKAPGQFYDCTSAMKGPWVIRVYTLPESTRGS